MSDLSNNNFEFNYSPEQNTNILKKSLIRDTIVIIIGLAFFLILNILCELLSHNIGTSLGLYDSGLNEFTSPSAEYIFSFISLSLSSFVSGWFILLLTKNRISDTIKLKIEFDKKSLFILIIAGLFVCGFANLFSYQIANIFKLPLPDSSFNNSSILSTLTGLLATAVCPAIFEEFLFRGVLIGALKKYGSTFSIIVSALIFSIAHMNVAQMIFAFIWGISFGFIFLKTNSLLPTIILHFINNFTACMLEIVKNEFGQNVYFICSNIIYILLIITGIIGLILLTKQDKTFFKLNIPKPQISSKYVYMYFIITALVSLIVLLIISTLVISLSFIPIKNVI